MSVFDQPLQDTGSEHFTKLQFYWNLQKDRDALKTKLQKATKDRNELEIVATQTRGLAQVRLDLLEKGKELADAKERVCGSQATLINVQREWIKAISQPRRGDVDDSNVDAGFQASIDDHKERLRRAEKSVKDAEVKVQELEQSHNNAQELHNGAYSNES